MAITVQAYSTARQNLLSNPFASESFVYAAQLVSGGYTFDATHTTRETVGNFIGVPVQLSGKAVSYSGDNTFLTCDDIDFVTTQGTLDAAYCIIHLMNTGSPTASDKLICCLILDGGTTHAVSVPIELSSCGLIGIQREQ
jgi:hypothetical protein